MTIARSTRSFRMVLGVTLALHALQSARAASLAAQSSAAARIGAVVDPVVATFPIASPYVDVELPSPSVLGHYQWRFEYRLRNGSVASLVLMTADPVATNDFERVISSALLYRCPVAAIPATPCGKPVQHRIVLEKGAFFVEVLDQAIVGELRRDQPKSYWRKVVLPGGAYALDEIDFEYPSRPAKRRSE